MVVVGNNVHKSKHLVVLDMEEIVQSMMVQMAHMVGDKVDMDLNPMEVFVSGMVWFENIAVEKNDEGKVHMDMVVEVHNHDKHHHIRWIDMDHSGIIRLRVP
ncbi:hypothetical protein PIB30_029575 [Stylosanthes scabra]|uniref:Uncharacterized protein n=1 Tax=Stylosanthes scabra TaxID=79078 RepID=A0ABU6XC64_9FABA|nr:hypothetical protein [Stylosanthes scabra]